MRLWRAYVGCRIVLQRVLVFTDVLVVYEHLCMFAEWWPLSRPSAGLDHHAHLRMAILRCKKEAQKLRDVPSSQSSTRMFVVQLKAVLNEIRRNKSRAVTRAILLGLLIRLSTRLLCNNVVEILVRFQPPLLRHYAAVRGASLRNSSPSIQLPCKLSK